MSTFSYKTYLLAQLSNVAYREELELRQNGALPDGWRVLASKNTNRTTGFVAYAFVNDSSRELVIAYRGSEINFNMLDWCRADLALAKDGDPSGVLKQVYQRFPLMAQIMRFIPSWDTQFSQGLEFAHQMVNEYGNQYQISVTGHSLGGALAQVTCKMFNLSGITFDPAGAKNIAESPQFKSWAKTHQLPDEGLGSGDRPLNYLVEKSPVSNDFGPHVGLNITISGTDHQNWTSLISDTWSRHSMPRILADLKDRHETKGLHKSWVLRQQALSLCAAR